MGIREFKLKHAFVSGPYRADTIYGIKANIYKAGEITLKLCKMGFVGICPHKNFGLFDGELPDEIWLNYDMSILSRCDLIVMMPNWKDSVGASHERDMAHKLGIPIYYWEEDQDKLRMVANI